MHISFNRVRSWLIVLVLSIVFPSMILIIGYAFWEQRREARFQAQETALRVARLAASEQEILIARTEQLLMVLAQLPAVRERNSEKCSRLFTEFMRHTFPLYTNLGAATPQGDVFCSGLPTGNYPNIGDREYFREAIDERRLGISRLMVGRISGKPAINMAYPAFDPDGPVHAVVAAGLDLEWLSSVAARAELPPQSRLLAVDAEGAILAHYPEPEKWVGKSAMTPLIKTMIQQKEGVMEADSLDGLRHLYGFTTLHPTSKTGALFVSVGIPYDVAFTASKRVLTHSIVLFLITLLLAAGGTWVGTHFFIRRRLESLITSARALGESEPQQNAAAYATRVAETVDQFEEVIEQMRLSLSKVTGRQADFAAMIAHDLRNPLQTIASAASLLRRRGERKEDEQALISMIEEGSDKLAEILNQFLEFSRYRAGYLNLKKEPVAVEKWLRETYKKYVARSEQANIRLELAVEPGIGFVSADREKLERVIDNLLSNALKFTPEEGEIELGARREGDGVEIWVKDTGIGIAPDEAKMLFSKYHQTDTRSSHKEGTGLGLLICKMIAEGHGGRIWVQSELNEGSMFYVWIPCAQQNIRPPERNTEWPGEFRETPRIPSS